MRKRKAKVSVVIPGAPLWFVFTVLLLMKLTGVVDWSWWVVFFPVYIVWAMLFAGVGIFIVCIAAIGTIRWVVATVCAIAFMIASLIDR